VAARDMPGDARTTRAQSPPTAFSEILKTQLLCSLQRKKETLNFVFPISLFVFLFK
jgi:hypothetical protein